MEEIHKTSYEKQLEAELRDERHRHDRYVDFELAQAKELEKYRAAEKEGRLWVAPCPMDAVLYMIVEREAKYTRKRYKHIRVIYLSENNFFGVLRDFGKTAFLTLEEAQKALEGMKHGK